MRSALQFSLLVAALLIASTTHASPKAATPEPTTKARSSKQAPTVQPTSAALATKTSYKLDPYKAMQNKLLLTKSGKIRANKTELELLVDADDGHVAHFTMAKAALIICGVTDPEKQKPYFEKLVKIDAEVKKNCAGIKSTKARAEALGKYLLAGPMKGGYVGDQSSLVKLLDTGKYNCVSSAVLYNLMAPRIGIQVRAVLISGHVFSRTLDFDIEPTSGDIYPLDDRMERSLRNSAKNNSSEAPFKQQVFRDMGNAGLLSTIYDNMGSALGIAKHYPEAITCYLKAGCLDAGNPAVVANMRAIFSMWINDAKANHDNKLASSIQSFESRLLRPYEETEIKTASN
jgi:hypothetical protein